MKSLKVWEFEGGYLVYEGCPTLCHSACGSYSHSSKASNWKGLDLQVLKTQNISSIPNSQTYPRGQESYKACSAKHVPVEKIACLNECDSPQAFRVHLFGHDWTHVSSPFPSYWVTTSPTWEWLNICVFSFLSYRVASRISQITM